MKGRQQSSSLLKAALPGKELIDGYVFGREPTDAIRIPAFSHNFMLAGSQGERMAEAFAWYRADHFVVDVNLHSSHGAAARS